MKSGTQQRIMASTAAVNWLLGWWGGTHRAVYFNGGTFDSGIPTDTNTQIYTAIGQDTSDALLYRNGVDFTVAGDAPSLSPTTASNDFFTNGLTHGFEASDSIVQEIILFDVAISSTDRTTIETDQATYYGV
jgi:hypothetical protein